MFSEIKEGLTFQIEKLIGKDDTATKYGSGTVEVFATPAMIALMEKTALKCVDDLLADGFTTVGTEIKVQHTKATPIGETVVCDAKIIEVDRKKIVFEVRASDQKGSIGSGTHTRFIINQADFMAKLI